MAIAGAIEPIIASIGGEAAAGGAAAAEGGAAGASSSGGIGKILNKLPSTQALGGGKKQEPQESRNESFTEGWGNQPQDIFY